MRNAHARGCAGFTLVELLVVIGIIVVLIGILLPTLSRARMAGVRTQCLSNLRQLQIAQTAYAVAQKNLLVYAGDGTEQGSWIGSLQAYSGTPLARRCPADRSIYFDTPIPGSNPARYRTTSYGINNYVSPTHAPFGAKLYHRISQVPHSSRVIQFAELAETAAYAGSDHLHVDQFYLAIAPQITIARMNEQMPLGRHGAKPSSWDAVLNFSFLDGHAESLTMRQVYTNPTQNLFNPLVAK